MVLLYDSWMTLVSYARQIMLAFLVVNSLLLIADIIKRRLLSRSVIWYLTMLAEPVMIVMCIGLIIGRPLLYVNSNLTEWIGFLLDILIMTAAAVSALIILIRGHIRIIDKRLPKFSECSTETLRFIAVRRLIIAGTVGTIASALFFIVAVIAQIPAFAALYILFWLGIFCPFLIFLPLMSIAVAGMEVVAMGIIFSVIIIEYFSIINGCFRYIFAMKCSKGIKALLAVLCVIFPPFGIIYGFCALGGMKKQYVI
ncbi:MAG: hypothetical protein K2J73_11645 [Oscillospiraceae bacterium]|nr:hypothetical protein [Oscillospiraceae bacterium]